MDFIKIFPYLIGFLFLSACARTAYLWDQGLGQLKLVVKARPNAQVLSDPEVLEKEKQKIRKIQKYKKYFYQYWEEKPTALYSKTVFLDEAAVSYLVISSPYDEIKAKEECFWPLGCFPYLGFFKKEKAKEYARSMEKEGFETYMRPVYAYSTLGYFNDRILSSFFQYNDFDLALLIFHELFHTLFFVKNEVELNENLAHYFSQEMVMEYFKWDEKERKKRERFKLKQEELSLNIVKMSRRLNRRYDQGAPLVHRQAKELREEFMRDTFYPHMKKLCSRLALSPCFPLKRNWNNASLAAFLTYERQGKKINELRKKLKLELRPFFHYVKRIHEEYQKEEREESFLIYLFGPLTQEGRELRD